MSESSGYEGKHEKRKTKRSRDEVRYANSILVINEMTNKVLLAHFLGRFEEFSG